jgi:hypothetical protein
MWIAPFTIAETEPPSSELAETVATTCPASPAGTAALAPPAIAIGNAAAPDLHAPPREKTSAACRCRD